MKKAMKKLCLIMAAIMCIAILPCQVNAAEAKPKLFIIGDSMAASYEEAKYPYTGWGQAVSSFFNDEIEVLNYGNAGESSRSFYYDYWKEVLNQMGEGDYLLMTFGGNDTKEDKETSSEDINNGDATVNLYRKTNPNLSSDVPIPEENGPTPEDNTTYSFKAFMKAYVKETLAKGATPILLTQPERRAKTSSSGITFGVATMAAYSQAIRDLADEINEDDENFKEDIICLEGSTTSLELYSSYGEEDSKKLFVFTEEKEDNTHFRDFGAAEIAGIIVEELINKGSDLTQYMKSVSTPIIYDADHNTAGTAIKKTDKKTKGTTLYPRAQIINKKNEATTVKVIMAEYDNYGNLIDILSKDEFTVPAKSVESFDAVYTMSDEEAHAGTVKMFVWNYDNLAPLDSKLIKWDFTKNEYSGISPLLDEKFESYTVGATINTDEDGKNGWRNVNNVPFNAVSLNGNIAMRSAYTAKNQSTSRIFSEIKIGDQADENMETVVEFDLYDTFASNVSLRGSVSGSLKDSLVLTTGAGNLAFGDVKDIAETDDGDIHHIKLVINEKQAKADLYVGGSETAAVTGVALASGTTSLTTFFIKSNGNTNGWRITIDNILIYRQKIASN